MKAIVINRESGERTVISDVIDYRIVYPDDERDFHWAIQMPLGHILDVPHRKFDCFFANK